MQTSRYTLLLLLAALAGCGGGPRVQALDGDAISAVQAEIKRQVGVYMRAAKLDPYVVRERTIVPVPRPKEAFACGKGNIDYDIHSVNAELTTTRTNSIGGGLSFTVPVQMVTVGGGFGASREVTNTQVLRYNVWPIAMEDQEPSFRSLAPPTLDEIQGAPIADTLLNLRNRQIFGAMKLNPVTGRPNPSPQPCFTNLDPSKPLEGSDDTYSLGLLTTIDVNGKVSISLTVVGVNASGEHKSVSGNTLLVTFAQHGLREVQEAVDHADKACAGNKKNTDACKSARGILISQLHQHLMSLNRPNLFPTQALRDIIGGK